MIVQAVPGGEEIHRGFVRSGRFTEHVAIVPYTHLYHVDLSCGGENRVSLVVRYGYTVSLATSLNIGRIEVGKASGPELAQQGESLWNNKCDPAVSAGASC